MLKIYQFVFLATLVSSTMLSNGTDETTIRQDMGSLQKSNHFLLTNETGGRQRFSVVLSEHKILCLVKT